MIGQSLPAVNLFHYETRGLKGNNFRNSIQSVQRDNNTIIALK